VENGFVVLRSNGQVRVWQQGADDLEPPSSVQLATQVVSGGRNVVLAIQTNGATIGWGEDGTKNVVIPLLATTALDVAVGSDFFVALATSDCDENGVADFFEVSDRDCNGNAIVDACDAIGGLVEDCDHNGLGDDCQLATPTLLESGQLGPIGAGSPQTWTAKDAPMPVGDATLRIRAHADLAEDYEYLLVSFGSQPSFSMLAGTENCGIAADWIERSVSMDTLRAARQPDGTLTVNVAASIAVNPGACPDGSWVEMQLVYEGATPADCDANGQLDSCEIAADSTLDANGNGTLDDCEVFVSLCTGDLNGSGTVDGADIGELLTRWGSPHPAADINQDGIVDGGDLGELLQAWGPCSS